MKQYVMSYYLANRWGSMVEQQKVVRKVESIHEARMTAERMIDRMKSKGMPVYPQYDLREEAL